MKILYIAGAGRSGSTLLEMILGNTPGFFSGGEILDFWGHANNDKLSCGCGCLFTACPIWSRVIEHFNADQDIHVEEIYELKQRFDRTRFLPFIGFANLFDQNDIKKYETALKTLYTEVKQMIGDEILVDSSKTPAHLFMLSQIPEMSIHVLHLVRDPRAVAFSWKKRAKIDPAYQAQETRMFQRSFINSAIRWLVENVYIEAFSKHAKAVTRMRYEDFCEKPFETLSAALKALDLSISERDLTFLKSPSLNLRPTHSVGGNPVRFYNTKSIQTKDEWKSQMSYFQKLMVETLAFPDLLRYNYLKGSRD